MDHKRPYTKLYFFFLTTQRWIPSTKILTVYRERRNLKPGLPSYTSLPLLHISASPSPGTVASRKAPELPQINKISKPALDLFNKVLMHADIFAEITSSAKHQISPEPLLFPVPNP